MVWKKSYMANEIARMGAFNWFEEFSAVTSQINVVIALML
jgi:hypothetical protein